MAYLDTVSFESLPILPTGTCVVAGVSAQVPVVVKVGKLPEAAEPNSRTMSVTNAWLTALLDEGPQTPDDNDPGDAGDTSNDQPPF
ncbi:hypothetical protein [Rhodococcus sp. USK13]|uniref:hypothetical protein n=1 Tax=Rhodococcus sp. USK13 TaxID=2806442 RepID=UPI001BCFA1BA|nr:hypothetical protein [Rhodococcus sp. USK13]